MKKPLILFSIFYSLILFHSCEENTNTNKGKESLLDSTEISQKPLPDKNAASFFDLEACTQLSDFGICSRGIPFAFLDRDFELVSLPKGATNMGKKEMKDEYAGTSWEAIEVTFPGGTVLIEPDFHGGKAIGRIRIEAKEFKNLHGIGVGSTVEELRNTYTQFKISSYEGMDVAEISLEGNPWVFFHVEDHGNQHIKTDAPNPSIEMLPPTAKIVRMIIWDPGVGMAL